MTVSKLSREGYTIATRQSICSETLMILLLAIQSLKPEHARAAVAEASKCGKV